MNLDDAAAQLYGLAPAEFTAARTTLEKQARSAGDRALAAAIRNLRRPSTVAWLANQLVRQHRDEVEPLLALGDELRDAQQQLHGEDLRRLSQQRHLLIATLVGKAAALGRRSGARVSVDVERGLEQTLDAALADPDARAALLAGRLTDGLSYAGFGPPAGSSAQSAAPAAGRARREAPRGTPTPGSAAQRRRQQQLDEARGAAETARAAAHAADEAAAAAAQEEAAAAETAARARARADELRSALAGAERDADQQSTTAAAAAHAAERTRRSALAAAMTLAQAEDRVRLLTGE